jgi:hypothetical protein
MNKSVLQSRPLPVVLLVMSSGLCRQFSAHIQECLNYTKCLVCQLSKDWALVVRHGKRNISGVFTFSI